MKGKRIHLRPLLESDLEQFLIYRTDPEVCKYQGFNVFSRQDGIDFIGSQKDKDITLRNEWVQIGIAENDTDKLIGDCAVNFLAEENRIVEIGCTITPTYQRGGYAKEALQVLFKELFTNQNVNKIKGLIATENTSSIKMVESLGFMREGHLRQSYFEDGAWFDEYIYGLLRTEFVI